MSAKLRVGIICGGSSLEHEVSLKSATYIIQTIDKRRFEIVILWINKKGSWYIIDKNFFSSYRKSKYVPILLRDYPNRNNLYINNINNLLKLDVIFPIIHGTSGEDGSLQGFLRIMNIPYVGSDVLGSAICMDKDITKRLLRDEGLPVVPFKTFVSNERQNINFYDLVNIFRLPLFIKPVNQGSSIGGSRVDNHNSFHHALNIAFSYSYKIIIEPFIIARELECAVLGNDSPEASICGEIIIKDNNFYTYSDKYIQRNSQIVIPAVLDDINRDKIRCIAIRAFQILNCFGMARVDVFLTKNNQIFINEVNTLPGFTDNSMYPKLWEITGLHPQSLLTKLIELALDRYNKNYLSTFI